MVEWKSLRKVSKKVELFVQAAELHAKRDTNYQQPSDREEFLITGVFLAFNKVSHISKLWNKW
jgi:hypothetical protein